MPSLRLARSALPAAHFDRNESHVICGTGHRIEACLIGPPEATTDVRSLQPADGSVNECCLPHLQLGRRGKPVLSASAMPEVSSIQNLMTPKKRSGLSSEKSVSRVPAANTSPNSTGGARVILHSNASWYQYAVARIDFSCSRQEEGKGYKGRWVDKQEVSWSRIERALVKTAPIGLVKTNEDSRGRIWSV
jgi:hypothetical protein